MIINELESIWKDAVLSYFKVVFQESNQSV
jgi:hypothetical protein